MIDKAGWTCDNPSLGRYKARDPAKRCRCDGCRAANSRYASTRAKWQLLQAPGRLVDVAATQAHLRHLRSHGLRAHDIATTCTADVSPSFVFRILRGDVTRLDRRLEAALLEVQASDAA